MKLSRFPPVLAIVAALCPATAAILKWANNGDAASMDPYTRQETVRLSFLANIYEPLARRDGTLVLEPALAVRWEQTAPTSWRFWLRQNVKWQDGSAFTAADVVFSVGRIQAKASLARAPLPVVKTVRRFDDFTVEFETGKPDPIFPREQTAFLIMSKAWCEAHGAAEPVALGGKDENFAIRDAMGTGPFRLVSRDPGIQTVVERNPGRWDKPAPDLDRVEFHIVSSAATRVAALLSGEMDMIYDVPPWDMPRIAAMPRLKVIQNLKLRTVFLGFNPWRDERETSGVKGKNPFKGLRVRQAFALVIEKQAIGQKSMNGLGRPAWTM